MKKFYKIAFLIIGLIFFSPAFDTFAKDTSNVIYVDGTEIPITQDTEGNIIINGNYLDIFEPQQLVDAAKQIMNQRRDSLVVIPRDSIMYVYDTDYYFEGYDKNTGQKYFQNEFFLYNSAADRIMFCVEPNQFKIGEGENIPTTVLDGDANAKEKVALISQVSNQLALESGDHNYAVAGQSLIHQTILNNYTVTNENILNNYKNNINNRIKEYSAKPSFASQSINLSFNYDDNLYEAIVHDENNVLSMYYNDINNLVVNNVTFNVDSNNNLYISTPNKITGELLINNETAQNKLHHNNNHYQPTYVVHDIHQDLVSNLPFDITYDFRITTHHANITGLKVDTSNNPLANAKFGLYADKNNDDQINSDEPLLNTITTNTDGIIAFNDIPLGNYIVKELEAPRGYIIDETLYPIDLAESNTVYPINQNEAIINVEKRGSFKITKTGPQAELLENVEFNIYLDSNKNNTLDSEDQLMANLITNNNGVAELNDLKLGTYFIQETKSQPGYELNQDIISVNVTDDNYNVLQDINIVNQYKLGAIEINKVNPENEPLEGVEFNVYLDINTNEQIDDEDQLICIDTTDQNGKININNLELGQYLIKETNTIDGYIKSEEQKIINIDKHNNNDLLSVTFVNQHAETSKKQPVLTGSTSKLVEIVLLISIFYQILILVHKFI